MNILTYILIGLSVGSISGALGIGGGVLIVPLLMWLCRFDPTKATGTSLAVLIPPIGLPAAIEAWNKNHVDVPAALWIAGAFMIGAYASRSLSDNLPEFVIRRMFGLLLLYIACRFLLNSDANVASAAAGVIAVLLAWMGFVWLRMLGRKHLPRPSLATEIKRMHEQGRGDTDYYI